jgi:hypothetical protein
MNFSANFWGKSLDKEIDRKGKFDKDGNTLAVSMQ